MLVKSCGLKRLISFICRPSEGWDPDLLKKNTPSEEERTGSQPSLGRRYKNSIALYIIIASLLFLSVVLIIGAPWASWWFYESDEFDAVYRAFKTNHMQNLSNFFLFSDVRGALPDRPNFGGNFFDTFHRPLVLVIDFIRYHFFCIAGLGYHLSNVFFHALNTSLIFLMSTTYVSIIPATFAGLFFGFHPQIAYSFGRVDCLQYSLNLTLILFILFFFKRYLDQKKSRYLVLTSILFATSLLLRETAIVLPFILMIGAYLYEKNSGDGSRQSFALPHHERRKTNSSNPLVLMSPKGVSKDLSVLKITTPLWIITLLFLTMRLFLYPISTTHSPIPWLARESTIGKKCFFIASTTWAIISDFFSLSWFSPTSSYVKILVVFAVLGFFTYLFLRNNHKKYLLFFLCSTMIMLWPAFLTGGYHPRYLYEAMPFIIAFFMVSFKNNKEEGPGSRIGVRDDKILRRLGRRIVSSLQLISVLLLTALLCFYVFLSIECFTTKRKTLNKLSSVFTELINKHDITSHPIVIIGTPAKPFGDGLPNLMRILQQEKQPIYFDCMLPSTHISMKKNWCYQTINGLPSSDAYTINLDSSQQIHIVGTKPLPAITPTIGTSHWLSNKHVVIKLNKNIIDQKPVLISWDYATNTFKTWNIS